MSTGRANSSNHYFEPLDGPMYDSLYAKIHARAIHRHRQTPEEQRPRISESEAERGYKLAYDQILTGLKYLAECEANEVSDKTLRNAAQILEKLYWNEPSNQTEKASELETAALAYYLAGYYARAFVLMQGVNASTSSSNNMMKLMFLRELPKIRGLTLKTLSQAQCRDIFLANSANRGEIDQIQAINFALEGTFHRIYLLLYEYARTGNDELIEQAIDFCNVGILFTIDQQSRDWWWTFNCTVSLLREYHRNSLWTCLRSMIDDDPLNLVRRYIRAAFQRPTCPILELWRSQSYVIENINDGRSYCIKMPTGSGKTRIAELAILKFLTDTQDEPGKKCLYVAPYRALAVELEQSLRQGFAPIGIGVSQLYGSYELNPAESLIVEDSRVLIATPEKMDAFLRYNTDIAQQVGLVIVDEGHIIGHDERGLRFELFLHRLVQRYERKGTRMLFISAVMPNVEQFSQWITGRESEDGVLTSDWQATQLFLGVLQWNGESGRVDHLYRNRKRLDGNSYIPNYARAFDPELLREANCGHRKYPGKNATKGEVISLAALEAVKEGAVLIFTPLPQNVESIAKKLIEAIELREKINAHLGLSQAVLPVGIDSREEKNKFDRCLEYAKESTGGDSIIVRALEKGFVIHDGDVPRALRVHLEELIREGILQVVVATTTLAQGVNLPVKTILIHSLYHRRIGNQWKPLDARDFWNLCGRAGRAMCETEGYVYVLAEPHEESGIRNNISKYVRQTQSEEIKSAIRQLLENIVRAWCQVFPHVGADDIAQLCQLLTENNEDWLSNKLQAELRVLDTQLLALIEEQKQLVTSTENQLSNITDPDQDLTTWIMDVFEKSMFYIQMNSDPSTLVSTSGAISLLVQRVEHIARVCKTPQRRHCYYRMGLSIEGCTKVESSKDDLATYLRQAEQYMDWSPEERAKYVVRLCADFLMQLEDISGWKESDKPSDCWPEVLEQWLMGKNASEIVASLMLPNDCNTAMKVSTLIDNLCEFRLPWGLNAIAMFWQNSEGLSENIDEMPFTTPPEIVNYFASMLRFGVHDPIATVAMAMGLDNRKAALILSEKYSGPIDAQSILFWLRTLDQNAVSGYSGNEALQKLLADFIASVQRSDNFIEFLRGSVPTTVSVEVAGYTGDSLVGEGTELLGLYEDGFVHLCTQTGDYLGTTEIEHSEALKRLQSGTASITVKEVVREFDEVLLQLLIR